MWLCKSFMSSAETAADVSRCAPTAALPLCMQLRSAESAVPAGEILEISWQACRVELGQSASALSWEAGRSCAWLAVSLCCSPSCVTHISGCLLVSCAAARALQGEQASCVLASGAPFGNLFARGLPMRGLADGEDGPALSIAVPCIEAYYPGPACQLHALPGASSLKVQHHCATERHWQ